MGHHFPLEGLENLARLRKGNGLPEDQQGGGCEELGDHLALLAFFERFHLDLALGRCDGRGQVAHTGNHFIFVGTK